MGVHISTLSKGGLAIRNRLLTIDGTGLCCDANTACHIQNVQPQWKTVNLCQLRAFKINYPMDNGNRNAASDAIHPGFTVRAKVRVKRKEDRNKLHQLHIQQASICLCINHRRTRKKGKSPERHCRGFTTVGQSMSLNTLSWTQPTLKGAYDDWALGES